MIKTWGRLRLPPLTLDQGIEPKRGAGFHAGAMVDEVATRVGVTPRTVCRWRHRVSERQTLALPARRAEGPRRGRPQPVHGLLDTLRREGLEGAPRPLGSPAPVWSAPWWSPYRRDVQHLQGARRRVGLAMARLGLAWHRPREELARRAPPWRPAKGGSTGAVPAGGAP